MRPFEATISYTASAAAVAAMFADPEFVAAKLAASEPTSSLMDVSSAENGGFTVTTRRVLPTNDLPAAVQRLIGASITIELSEQWGPAAHDGSREGNVTLDVAGKPARATGAMRLVPVSGDRSNVVYEGTVTASIPLIGGRIEEQAVQQVQTMLDLERTVGTAWLASQPS